MTQPAPTPSAGGETEDRLARLRERAEREFPESWKPKEAGEEIAGELLRYERGTTTYGQKIIVVLRLTNGLEYAIWLIHGVLLGEFERQRPAPGEFLLVRYNGVKPREGGADYHHYSLAVDRDETTPWDDGLDANLAGQPLQAPPGHAGEPPPSPQLAPTTPAPPDAPVHPAGPPHPSAGLHQPLDVPVDAPPPQPPTPPTSSPDEDIPF